MMLSLMACVKEDLPGSSTPVDVEGKVTLDLSIVVPEAQIATKGTFAAPTITSLNVLVFDDKGFLVEKVAATNNEADGWDAVEVTDASVSFNVTLTKSGTPRKLHFVANTDVTGVGYGMETDIMTSLTTSGNQDAYWQVVALPRLISAEDFTSPIYLVRNHAKVTLVSSVEHFKPTGYALLNYPVKGTVAPYNTSKGKFQDYNTGATGKNHTALVEDLYASFMPEDVSFSGVEAESLTWTALTAGTVADNMFPIEGTPLYTYESSYGNTYLLVKGIYDSNNDGNFDEAETYYKIDFYSSDLGQCDILRNINYQFSITNVVGAGYPESELTNLLNPDVPAGNNIDNNLLTENLVNISDGTQRLSVEYTSKWVVSEDPFTLKYMFQPSIASSETNNTLAASGPITITQKVTDEHGSLPVQFEVMDPEVNNGYSTIEITPQDFPESGDIYKKEITITSNYEAVTMTRVVKLYFINPYQMTVECPDELVPAALGTEVTINTIIPGNLPSTIFPLVFEIEADAMSIHPNTAKAEVVDNSKIMPVVSGTSIIPGKVKNTFHYERTLTLAEYEALGGNPDGSATDQLVTVPSYFLTNKAASSTTVYVRNEYFTIASDSFTTPKFFTNLAFPNGVMSVADSQTVFTFDMETADPVNVTLVGLTNAAGASEFVYTPTAAGQQTMTLKTVNASGTVSVTLEADESDYSSASLSAEQKNRILIANSAAISFTWSSSRVAPNRIDQISVEGGTVTYEEVSFGGSGTNRTISISNLVFEGATINNDSEVTIQVSWNGNEYVQTSFTTTIGALRGN